MINPVECFSNMAAGKPTRNPKMTKGSMLSIIWFSRELTNRISTIISMFSAVNRAAAG